MVSPFTIYPSSTRGKRHRGYASEIRTDFAFFALAIFSLTLALAYQQGEFHSHYGTKSPFFLGTTSVSAAAATTALSTNTPRAGRPTMVSMAAGSSRTLIELTNRENDENGEFQFEVTYLDEDDEQGLLVLRRANTDPGHLRMKSSMERSRTIYKRAVRVLKNPIVVFVVAGNIATMAGMLPPGIAGFLPALGIFLKKNMKWTAPILGKLGSFQFGRAVLAKVRVKLGKVISNLYKNRSRYSLLGDCLWHVDANEKKNKNGSGNIDGGSTPSTAAATNTH